MPRRLSILVFCLLFFAPLRAEERIAFRNLTTKDGLPSNQITAIYRDTKGFLWVGTFEGLCRYDAYRFRQFSTRDGLPGKNITSIAEDKAGRIWVLTSEGSACYSYPDDRFSPVEDALTEMGIHIQDPDDFGSSPDRRYFWAAAGEMLSVRDEERSVVSEYPIPGSSYLASGAQQDRIYYTDTDGRLLYIDFRTGAREEPAGGSGIRVRGPGVLRVYADRGGGLWVYSLNMGPLRHYTPGVGWRQENLPGVTDQYNRITAIAEDSSGNLWLTTTHQGLYMFNQDGKVRQMIHEPDKLSSLPGNNLYALHVDQDDIVWVGNFKLGLSSYAPHSQSVSHYFVGGSDDILSFCETPDALYIGTDGSGLLRADSYDKTFTPVPTGANVINRITQDRQGDLWIGTWENGLVRLGPDGRKKAAYTRENSALAGNSVFSILEGSDGYLYLGLFSSGVQRLDPKNAEKSITTLYTISEGNLLDMAFLNDSTLVVAASRGMAKVDLRSENDLPGFPADLIVDDIFTDRGGYLWMAGRRGIWYWDPNSNTLVKLGIDDGLPSDSGRSFAEDVNGRIWIATTQGLCSVDLSSGTPFIQKYGQEHGLGWTEFNKCAMITLRQGDILAGTPQGFTAIVPHKSTSDQFDKSILLTSVVSAGSDRWDPVLKPTFDPSEIIIQRDLLPLSLHFSCMDFDRQDAVTYEYRINGREWAPMSGPDVELSYLPAGHYEIRVRARDTQGLWSPHIKNLSLTVRQPWYWSLPARIFYLLLLLTGLWMFLSFSKQRKERQETLARISKEAEDQKKLMDMKLTFFANISHELRTPLSLIINPLDEFVRRYPQHGGGFLSTARNNASYLKELIDELLSFRKIDAGGEVMHYLHQDIVTILKDAFLAYQSIADSRKIAYSFRADPQVIEMDFDREKMTKVLRNLLTNAFKFTPDGGRIDVTARKEEDQLLLRVADTGPGIPEAEREKVFDMFYQVSGDANPQGGSGIGLYLVNQYVQAHHGGIAIGDNLPHGAVFSIWLPLAAETEAVSEPGNAIAESPAFADIQIREEAPRLLENTLLLVDDNAEFLAFLNETLSSDYRILQATEGAEALEILAREKVDLVISDVMMPNMNGLELCRAIRNNVRTARIPILLLTAKDSDEFKLEGLNEGADDYIAKPFNMDLLKMRITQFIENRRQQEPAFEGEMSVDPSKVVVVPHDRQFVEAAIRVVEENLADADFSVEDLASRLNYSRGYLYKKLLKITGNSPIVFIRTIRMKRAQQLLAESQLQVAEVAYKLGYHSPKTFAKHFRSVFGMSPSEYIRSWKNVSNE